MPHGVGDAADSPRAAAVARLLTDMYSSAVAVRGWRQLEPWTVARVELAGAGAPSSTIVKWVRAYPVEARSERDRLFTELTALRFLSDDLGIALAPRVLAADLAAGLLVLEDLAPRVPLDRAAAAGRPRGARRPARRLRPRPWPAQRRDRYPRGRLLRAARHLGPVNPVADRVGRFARLRNEAQAHATALGTPIAGQAESELAVALDELNYPGPFLTLSNGDAEANNVLVRACGGDPDARLIDFEFAGFAHALADAVCLYVPGPSWLSVGDPAASGLAAHYRSALAEGVPEAEDDRRYGLGLAAACVSFALIRLQRFARLDGRPPGDGSRLQLVATLEAAARTAEAHRALASSGPHPRREGLTRAIAARTGAIVRQPGHQLAVNYSAVNERAC